MNKQLEKRRDLMAEEHGDAAGDSTYTSSFKDGFDAGVAEMAPVLNALKSIAAFHLKESQIRACGGDTIVTDTEIAREALKKIGVENE